MNAGKIAYVRRFKNYDTTAPLAELFRTRLHEILLRNAANFVSVKVERNENIYTCGDNDQMLYFIESGRVKLLMLSPAGKECLLNIYTPGDIFGELCLAGACERLEIAMAMEDTRLKKVSCSKFFLLLANDLLFESFVQYLALRVAEQQQIITYLMTVDSEYRLAEALLLLARKVGKKESSSICIELRISHEDLSKMVGTTRPWISRLLQKFRKLGLIETSAEHFLIIKAEKLTAYLAEIS